MKRTVLFLLFAAVAGTLHARVFETYDQCVTRYGKPVTIVKTPIGSNVSFIKNGVSVTVEFRKDTAVGITYVKIAEKTDSGENRAFSKDEVTKLLALNGGDHVWGPEKKDMHDRAYWATTDKALTARFLDDRMTLNIQDGAEYARKTKDVPPVTKPAPRDLEGF